MDVHIEPVIASIALALQDTAGKVAYVPRAGGPIDTSAYMWAGYAITLVIYGLYIALLFRRMTRVTRIGNSLSGDERPAQGNRTAP